MPREKRQGFSLGVYYCGKNGTGVHGGISRKLAGGKTSILTLLN